MSRRAESGLERALGAYSPPGEAEAAERTLPVVRAAVRRRERAGAPRLRLLRRFAAASAAAAVLAVLSLTPAGADVRQWIADAIDGDGPQTVPFELPTQGSILTGTGEAVWIANADGSRRRLGPYREASLSPQGLNVAVGSGRELAAVSAQGELRWSLTAPGRVADPAWAPSGIRIAYRSGGELRVVDGDGSGDQRVQARAGRVPPAWRPQIPDQAQQDVLAFVDGAGRVRVADVVATTEPLALETTARVRDLAWLADGRLAVATDSELTVHAPDGRLEASFAQPAGSRVTGLAAAADGRRLALARTIAERGGLRGELVVIRAEPGRTRQRVLFSGPGEIAGLAFSPNARWLAFGWPPADSWLFVRPAVDTKLIERINAIADISARFRSDPDDLAPPGFPRIFGWCC